MFLDRLGEAWMLFCHQLLTFCISNIHKRKTWIFKKYSKCLLLILWHLLNILLFPVAFASEMELVEHNWGYSMASNAENWLILHQSLTVDLLWGSGGMLTPEILKY